MWSWHWFAGFHFGLEWYDSIVILLQIQDVYEYKDANKFND